jgi:GDP-L-fucose synthase
MIESWVDKKVLVTGGSGFIGHAVIKQLKGRGAKDENMFIPRSKDYDLAKEADVQKLFEDFKPDAVFHLAAKVGGVFANMTAKGDFFYGNVMMNTMIVEYSRRNNVEKMMLMGSGCIYPKFAEMPVKETALWDGFPEETNFPYAMAKRLLLIQSMAYREQYGFNSVYVLPGNLYGAHDNFHLRDSHVVPALIRKFVEAVENGNDEVVVWGDGSATRDFQYVDDAAGGIVDVMEKWDSSEPLNISEGKEVPIKKIVELIAELTEFKGKIVWDTDKPNGQPRRALDVSRAREVIDYKTGTPLREGLKLSIDWFKNNINNFRDESR